VQVTYREIKGKGTERNGTSVKRHKRRKIVTI